MIYRAALQFVTLLSLLQSITTLAFAYCGGGRRVEQLQLYAAKTELLPDKNDLLNKHSRLCLAPMMDYTGRHFRTMIRLISSNILTCTEMVAANDLLSNKSNDNIQHLLGQSTIIPEGPSVLQLGGNDATQLYNCAKLYHEYSQRNVCEYTAINLNCGCPSPSVSGKRCFGAALMKDPNHVSKLVRSIHDGAEGTLPVTLKCRIGLWDDNETPFSRQAYDSISDEKEYQRLKEFIEIIANDGIVTHFQIHARIAVLGGLSPADNRRVPPLKYEYVHRLVRDYPELKFVLNGGINSLTQAEEILDENNALTGVMIGRGMVADPWSFAMADELIYGDANDDKQQHQPLCTNRREILEAYGRHADHEELHNNPATIRRRLVAACAHLFAGERNAKQFRMELDEIANRPERLEREARAKVWSSSDKGASTLASAFAVSSSTSSSGGWDRIEQAKASTSVSSWDDIQAIDDNKKWDENEPPLSELILEAAHRNFGDEILSSSRKESYDKKVWEEEEGRRRTSKGDVIMSITEKSNSNNDKDNSKVSGGVVDGWFNNGLN